MPNLGAPELLGSAVLLLIAGGIGYWCMTVFRAKGRSAGGGFALGFFLTLFFTVLGAIAALLIVYLSGPAAADRGYGEGFVPQPPPPVSPDAQMIATFGPTTGWHGRRIIYDAGRIVIEGVGSVSAPGVLSYEEQGQIEWASPAMRDWLVGVAQST